MSRQVWIVDPGFSANSGHHPAILDSLVHLKPEVDIQGIQLFTHQSCPELDAQYTSLSLLVSIERHFSLDTYQLSSQFFGPGHNSPDHLRYVTVLADEIADLLGRAASSSEEVLFLIHTVTSEVLEALDLAVSREPEYVDQFYAIYLMYNPGLAQDLSFTDTALASRYAHVLRKLSRFSTMRFFTTDSEVHAAYCCLAEDSIQMTLAPYFVAGMPEEVRDGQEEVGGHQSVLFYAGDVKDEKGFHRVPELLLELFDLLSGVEKAVVHYSGEPTRLAALKEVISQLKKLEEQDAVTLYEGFLEPDRLRSLLASTDLLVLNYEEVVYSNKSSGFLWLGARLKKAFLVPAETWLERELLRLGYTDGAATLSAKLMSEYNLRLLVFAVELTNEQRQYRHTLFADYWSVLFDAIWPEPVLE